MKLVHPVPRARRKELEDFVRRIEFRREKWPERIVRVNVPIGIFVF